MTSLWLPDRVWFNIPTTGTGSFTVGTAVLGCRTPATASMVDGDQSLYVITDALGAWEKGWTQLSSTTTIGTRNVIASTNSNAPIVLTGAAACFFDTLSGLSNLMLGPSMTVATSSVTLSQLYGYAGINNTSGGTLVVNLPVAPFAGYSVLVKDEGGNTSSHPFNVTPPTGTIEGAASFAIQFNYGFQRFRWNGSAYFTL